MSQDAYASRHLINNGVDETPPFKPTSNGHSSTAAGGLNPHDLFIDLDGTNVGFKHWHPVSVVERGGKLCGQSDLGGVWEWTSSVLEKHGSFVPMELYPGYTGMSESAAARLCLWVCSNLAAVSRLGGTQRLVTDLTVADFFDGKHNITLGGSWATHPRIAGRKTL